MDPARYQRPGTLQLPAPPPLSLYVHLPWCIRKCPYCDFNSHEPASSGAPFAAYVDALIADLESALPLVWGRTVHSVFLGGGTPSLFPPEQIERLLDAVRARLRLTPECEVTMEANPGTFESERFQAFARAGVTRLSLGVQTFNDRHLRALGRVHDATQACAAAESAARHFKTFNLDLMYALPAQTMEELRADLARALSFSPPHLSVYHLTIEPNTVFAKHPPVLPDEDHSYDMLDEIVRATSEAGLGRYEVSAFARPGHRCGHNLNYWQFGDYLGIGAGAHGKLSFAHRVVRQVRWRDPKLYLERASKGEPISQENEISRADLPFEFMLNAMRLRDGVPLAWFTERTGLAPNALAEGLRVAQSKGLVKVQGDQVAPTPQGFDFLSDLQALFLPKDRAAR